MKFFLFSKILIKIQNKKKMNLYKTLNYIIAVFSIILCILGTIGNIITLLMCLRKNLRKRPLFIFMMFTAIMNIFPLVSIAFYSVVIEILKIENQTIFYKINAFISSWGSQSTNYLLVSILYRLSIYIF